jgi:hypothetical protein
MRRAGIQQPEPPARIPGVEHAQDVRVLQPTARRNLALEAFGAEGRAEIGVQQLERPVALKLLAVVR